MFTYSLILRFKARACNGSRVVHKLVINVTNKKVCVYFDSKEGRRVKYYLFDDFYGLSKPMEVIYYDSGRVKYVGEVREGEPWGFGYGFWESGRLWYVGEFRKGKPDGYGKIYFQSGQLRYKGEFEQMEYFGQGTEYYENGKKCFEGSFRKTPYFFYGARCYGEGRLYYEDGSLRYEGSFSGSKNYHFKDGIEYLKDGRIVIHGKGLGEEEK